MKKTEENRRVRNVTEKRKKTRKKSGNRRRGERKKLEKEEINKEKVSEDNEGEGREKKTVAEREEWHSRNRLRGVRTKRGKGHTRREGRAV